MKKLFPLFAIAFLALAFLPFAANAAGLIPCGEPGNPCGLCHIFVLGENIINFFLIPDTSGPNKGFAIVPIVATILIIVGGFLLMTAGGNPDGFKKATAVLTAVVVGLIIIYASWMFLNALFSAIGVNPDFNLKSWTDTKSWCPL